MFPMNGQKFLIWMLEDDQDDRYLTQSIIDELKIDVSIVFFSGSDEFFSAMKKYNRPNMILIDYNSRPLNGIEVLSKMKSEHICHDIPVIILSEVSNSSFAKECYRLGASSFIVKPFTEKLAEQKIETFFRYWSTVAETNSAD